MPSSNFDPQSFHCCWPRDGSFACVEIVRIPGVNLEETQESQVKMAGNAKGNYYCQLLVGYGLGLKGRVKASRKVVCHRR